MLLSVVHFKANFKGHLPQRDLAIFNFSARLNDLKPMHVVNVLGGFGDCIVNGSF